MHGGPKGFHTRLFNVSTGNNQIIMNYMSRDGEEGYPGNLDFTVTFTLHHNTLTIQYHAYCDQDTIINFTNHSYFALQGQGMDSVDHQFMKTNADRYALNDRHRLVTGDISHVHNTPFEFLKGKQIGKDIFSKDKQISFTNGYDHYFLFKENEKHYVYLHDDTTKHELIIQTDLPGFHFYVPDYKEAISGKYGSVYKGHCAVCIETSKMPDAVHLSKDPETLLKAFEEFTSLTTYTFR